MSSRNEGQEREAAKSSHPSVNWYPDLERMARRLTERHAGAGEGPPEQHEKCSTNIQSSN